MDPKKTINLTVRFSSTASRNGISLATMVSKEVEISNENITNEYIIVAIISIIKYALGIFFTGSFVSSEIAQTSSNPIKILNIIAAAINVGIIVAGIKELTFQLKEGFGFKNKYTEPTIREKMRAKVRGI
jgi:hypothetical protein